MKAVHKYEIKSYDKILLRVPKGEREAIQEASERAGKSMNRFILDAVAEAVRDAQGQQEEV